MLTQSEVQQAFADLEDVRSVFNCPTVSFRSRSAGCYATASNVAKRSSVWTGNIGPVTIKWKDDRFYYGDGYIFIRFDKNIYENGEYDARVELLVIPGDDQHPHAGTDNFLCKGDWEEQMFDYIEDRDWPSVVATAMATFFDYNPGDAYRNLPGGECGGCGYDMIDEYICRHCDGQMCQECYTTCSRCGDYICERCRVYCHQCDNTFCEECSIFCTDCGRTTCTYCIEDSDTECTCGESAWPCCSDQCYECGKFICPGCRDECGCGRILCQNCSFTCEDCDDAMCRGCCETYDTAVVCSTCHQERTEEYERQQDTEPA